MVTHQMLDDFNIYLPNVFSELMETEKESETGLVRELLPGLKVIDKEYRSKKILQYMKNGKTQRIEINGQKLPRIDGTNARVINLSSVMTFIEYLEKNYA